MFENFAAGLNNGGAGFNWETPKGFQMFPIGTFQLCENQRLIEPIADG